MEGRVGQRGWMGGVGWERLKQGVGVRGGWVGLGLEQEAIFNTAISRINEYHIYH